MGYSIYIGEAEIDDDPIGDLAAFDAARRLGHDFIVRKVERPDAPSFDEDYLTGHGNSRHPSYNVWSDFARDVGLADLFFDDEHALMATHPGIVVLTEEHPRQIKRALRTWRVIHTETLGFMDGQDFHGARLVWLEWWVRWALDNCKVPVIYNH